MVTSLSWIPESVQKIMRDNRIRNREELAQRLQKVGIGRMTVYRAFDATWNGRATTTILAALAHTFRVPLSHLVQEPAEEGQDND